MRWYVAIAVAFAGGVLLCLAAYACFYYGVRRPQELAAAMARRTAAAASHQRTAPFVAGIPAVRRGDVLPPILVADIRLGQPHLPLSRQPSPQLAAVAQTRPPHPLLHPELHILVHELGFPQTQARQALLAAANDIPLALDLLTSREPASAPRRA